MGRVNAGVQISGRGTLRSVNKLTSRVLVNIFSLAERKWAYFSWITDFFKVKSARRSDGKSSFSLAFLNVSSPLFIELLSFCEGNETMSVISSESVSSRTCTCLFSGRALGVGFVDSDLFNVSGL